MTGDLVFIEGNSWRSNSVKLFGGNENEYTHIGLVYRDSLDNLFLVHSTPEKKSNRDGVTQDNLQAYLSKNDIDNWKISRVKNLNAKQKSELTSIIYYYSKSNLPFDNEFDLKTKDALYCSELVANIYDSLGISLYFKNNHRIIEPMIISQSEHLVEIISKDKLNN